MSKIRSLIDAHSHLADPRFGETARNVIQKSLEKGLSFFMQGGVGPEDWQRQKALQQQFPKNIGTCFGLHPYWVSDHTTEACEEALDQLASELKNAMALGELGLDFRPKIVGERHAHQIDYFEKQLELAHFAHKPIVLHIVQAHFEALQVLNAWAVPAQGGFVHSFNGSAQKALDFMQLGLMISIGGPVCRPDNQRLHQAVKEIPIEMLLIESDSPDQAAIPQEGVLNTPESILEVARTIGTIKSLDPDEILDITTANFKRLFSLT